MGPIEFGAQIRARRLEQHLETAKLAKLIVEIFEYFNVFLGAGSRRLKTLH